MKECSKMYSLTGTEGKREVSALLERNLRQEEGKIFFERD